MNRSNGMRLDALLEEAANRLRDAATAEMPPGLIAATAEAIANQPTPGPLRQRTRKMVARVAGLAATLLLTVVGVAVFTMHGGTQVAFAQVLDNAKKAASVAFWLSEGVGQAAREHKCFAQGEKVRVEHSSGIVMITDARAKKCLYVDASSKTAGLFTLHEHTATELATGVVDQLRQVRPTDAEPIGKELIDGKTADVFRVSGIKLFGIDSGKGEMRVWVDPELALPWRLELRIGATPFVILRKLKWNSPIEPSLLDMKIPDGYTEQPEDAFRKLLRPDVETPQRPTPAEAFRKWSGQSK